MPFFDWFRFARQHRQVLHGRGLWRALGTLAFATRGWGKTSLSLHLAAQAALAAPPTDTALWLTPVADQFRAAWRALRRAYARHIRRAHRGEGRVDFAAAGALEFRSAFDPDHLRGKTYRAVVLDEAALIPADGWQACIRPTQRRADDWYVLLTTPRGQDWVVALAEDHRSAARIDSAGPATDDLADDSAGDTADGGAEPFPADPVPAILPPTPSAAPRREPGATAVFRFPAFWTDAAGRRQFADNIDRRRVLAAARELPQAVFAREYLCDFGAAGDACFTRVEEHIDRTVPPAGAGRADPDLRGPFVIGVDWGFAHDYTAACVLDLPTGRVAEWFRLRRLSSAAMCAGVAALARRYDDAFCLCDVTGLQDQALSLLQGAGAWAAGFIFTPQSKTDLLEHLLVQWEHGRVRIPAWPPLLAELKVFTLQYTPATRQRKYAAAPGRQHHDDCVIALALAWWAILQYPGDPRRSQAQPPLQPIPPIDWDRFFL